MSKAKQPKRADSLRMEAMRQGRKHYAYPFTLGDILVLEKQIRDCVSLPLAKLSLTYTNHLTHLNGMHVVVIYDKKRNCIESIVPGDLVQTWIGNSKVRKYKFEKWRNEWEN